MGTYMKVLLFCIFCFHTAIAVPPYTPIASGPHEPAPQKPQTLIEEIKAAAEMAAEKRQNYENKELHELSAPYDDSEIYSKFYADCIAKRQPLNAAKRLRVM